MWSHFHFQSAKDSVISLPKSILLFKRLSNNNIYNWYYTWLDIAPFTFRLFFILVVGKQRLIALNTSSKTCQCLTQTWRNWAEKALIYLPSYNSTIVRSWNSSKWYSNNQEQTIFYSNYPVNCFSPLKLQMEIFLDTLQTVTQFMCSLFLANNDFLFTCHATLLAFHSLNVLEITFAIV